MRSSNKTVSGLLSLKEIKLLLPGNLAFSTLHRWRTTGLVGPDGTKVRLPMRKIGGKFFIDENDLWSWLELIGGQDGTDKPPKPRLDHDELERRLDAENL